MIFFSELDDEVIKNVFQYFLTLKNQIFITSTSEPSGSLTVKKFNIVKGELV
jgi:recombinational DNA repair ATPase RecF